MALIRITPCNHAFITAFKNYNSYLRDGNLAMSKFRANNKNSLKYNLRDKSLDWAPFTIYR
jgi:hypothetical protein